MAKKKPRWFNVKNESGLFVAENGAFLARPQIQGSRPFVTLSPDFSQAKRQFRRLCREMASRHAVEPADQCTLRMLKRIFLNNRKRRLGPRKARAYADALALIVPRLGVRWASRLMPDGVEGFKERAKAEGIKPAEIKAAVVALRDMLDFAAATTLIASNPLKTAECRSEHDRRKERS